MQAYFDCFCGISGDMTLGAFIDLGVPVGWLKERIGSLPLSGFDISVSTASKNGINGKSVRVHTKDRRTSRAWSEIRAMIRNSPLSRNVISTSLDIFERIAGAEAGIHGCTPETVHFHEIGGVDAIVDIVGTALCLEYLGVEKVTASTIPLGTGFVRCDHGTLPVPAPATLAILKGIPVYGTDISGELVTPTGAAIIAALSDTFGPMPEMVVKHTGYGAGTREIESMPNLLRVVIGDLPDAASAITGDRVMVLETCIDDMNPEIFGFLMDRLFREGALDVYWIPVYMKKNRPGTLVKVICPEGTFRAVSRCILSETTSTGIRTCLADRIKLNRESVEVDTVFGRIRVKRIQDPDGGMRIVPEYDVCRRIALEKNIPLRVVYETIAREAGHSPTGR